jgi:hypothetical protein
MDCPQVAPLDSSEASSSATTVDVHGDDQRRPSRVGSWKTECNVHDACWDITVSPLYGEGSEDHGVDRPGVTCRSVAQLPYDVKGLATCGPDEPAVQACCELTVGARLACESVNRVRVVATKELWTTGVEDTATNGSRATVMKIVLMGQLIYGYFFALVTLLFFGWKQWCTPTWQTSTPVSCACMVKSLRLPLSSALSRAKVLLSKPVLSKRTNPRLLRISIAAQLIACVLAKSRGPHTDCAGGFLGNAAKVSVSDTQSGYYHPQTGVNVCNADYVWDMTDHAVDRARKTSRDWFHQQQREGVTRLWTVSRPNSASSPVDDFHHQQREGVMPLWTISRPNSASSPVDDFHHQQREGVTPLWTISRPNSASSPVDDFHHQQREGVMPLWTISRPNSASSPVDDFHHQQLQQQLELGVTRSWTVRRPNSVALRLCVFCSEWPRSMMMCFLL